MSEVLEVAQTVTATMAARNTSFAQGNGANPESRPAVPMDGRSIEARSDWTYGTDDS